MTFTSTKYEYYYQTHQSGHHHAYLKQPLIKMISETILPRYTNQQKLRILDIGCGNGSLSNFIAQHGYEVVGIRSVLKLASQYLQGFETNPCRFSLNVTIRV